MLYKIKYILFFLLLHPLFADDVGTFSELQDAIIAANAGTVSTITFTDNIENGGKMRPLNANPNFTYANQSFTIDGGGFTFSGGTAERGFFARGGLAVGGSVTIQNLTISSNAQGGTVATAAGGAAGGGGGGLGGGLFVAEDADVTIQSVIFNNCSATGGNGGNSTDSNSNAGGTGGGGMGGDSILGGFNIGNGLGGGGFYGNGGSSTSSGFGGGGGGGAFSDGSNATSVKGGDGGNDFDGTAGGGLGSDTVAAGSNGGDGGGGGGGSPLGSAGGNGGYGGGGAGGAGDGFVNGFPGGTGGFGGGGGGGSMGFDGRGNDGGFGGGGGGAGGLGGAQIGTGGTGGFGGGGAGSFSGSAKTGGFGGGSGGLAAGGFTDAAGGGGAGLGGAIFIQNGGTLTIEDDVVFTLNTTVGGTAGTGGAQAATDGQALGNDIFMMSGAQLNFNIANNAEISSNIESDLVGGAGGGLTKLGSAVLTLSGANTFTGTTTVSAGTLALNHATALGSTDLSIGSSGTARFDTVPSTLPSVSGTGTLEFNDSFDITTNNSGFTGSVVISSGTLEFSIVDAVRATQLTIDTGTTARYNTALTVVPTFVGAGTLQFDATLEIASSNTSFTGPVTIESGTVTLSNANALSNSSGISLSSGGLAIGAADTIIPNLVGSGNIAINDTAIFNSSSDTTYSGSISGTDALTKQGTGILTLSGDSSSYAQPITLSDGTTIINGNLSQADTTVGSSATLRGIGSINSLTVNGILFPGNSIGTISILGNYIQAAGSTLQIEIDDAGNSDLVDITGTATISPGATLEVIPLAGFNYSVGQVYTILQASSVSGTFSTFTVANSNASGVDQIEAIYNATNIQLLLTAASESVTPCNASQVYLTANLLNRVNHFQWGILNDQHIQRVMTDQLSCQKNPSSYRSYFLGDYNNGHTQETDKMVASSYHMGGFQFGLEKALSQKSVIGALFGYTHAKDVADSHCANARSNDYTFGLYGQWLLPHTFIDLSALYTYNDFDTQRLQNKVVINDSDFGGSSVSAHLRGTFTASRGIIDIWPHVGLNYYYNHTSSYTENLATTPTFDFFAQNDTLFEFETGLRLAANIAVGKQSFIIPQISGTWIQNLTSDTYIVKVKRSNTDAYPSPFRIDSADHHLIQLTGELTANINRCVSINALYQTNLGGRFSPNNEWRAGIRWVY